MFSGIIEEMATIVAIEQEKDTAYLFSFPFPSLFLTG